MCRNLFQGFSKDCYFQQQIRRRVEQNLFSFHDIAQLLERILVSALIEKSRRLKSHVLQPPVKEESKTSLFDMRTNVFAF
ncbi:hypothetical protein Gasu2_44940 [Galdieria sulphuraria]|uniref:Uncharacterized protein n=1 Tax=Galdieria sulphuraria TaxID=130081 RepID=M2W7J7_GALSU|nr:uncharacterized protein Gasu_08710 [Galdieria sulphuraria]EME31791.1 hypothetical protein Gasu_08710 [Galdieria sulphuraria]GJD10296.1 hypothetical protein Gasu2_44940 [Galdieria sulphuraria]|eukprot:XP_005708311.1 hypothetical protein Gasu_08710 [Galdieria sulphuraria]